MRVRNWTLRMKLRVSQLIVKIMILIMMICAGKDVPGRKLKGKVFLCLLLHHLLSLIYSPHCLLTSHSHLFVTGVQQVAMGSTLDDASLCQDVITIMATRTNHLVQ
jgi:hypothetical protein